MESLYKDSDLSIKEMNNSLKKIIRKVKIISVVMIAVQLFYCYSADVARAAEFASLIEAIQATTTPRTYTLEANETTTTPLGNIGQWNSVLTIDGGEGHYGITNASTANDTRLFVSKNQTLYLQNLGTYTTTTSNSIVEGVDIITEVTVGNSVNNFGKTSDRVAFLRSAGTSHISNSVFYNNRGKYGVLQNREQGTMSITGSVFVSNTVPQGAVHNDGTNRMTEISNSIFYNNMAVTQTSGDADLQNRSASAVFNKPDRIIDIITGTQFISNTTIATAHDQHTGTIYNNGGIIGEISNSVFYNNSNQSGSVINNMSSTTATGTVSSGTITTLSNSTFAQNTSDSFGAAILNARNSSIGTITGSNFVSNVVTYDGGAIYNAGDITTLASIFSSNTALINGGALYNNGIITNAISASFDGNMAADGGAIYNASDTAITIGGSSIFSNNLASSSGGAIYNAGTTNIVASANDIVFTDNQSGVTYTYDEYNNITGYTDGLANDVHNTNILNLNAGAGRNIVFDGTITGDSSSRGTICVNDSTQDTNVDGTIQFNDTVSNNRIIQKGGILEFLNSGSTTISTITDANTYGGTDAYMVEVNGGNLVSDNSVFANNLAGAILIAVNGNAEITDSTFISNTASNGGAVNNAGAITDLSGTYTSNSATGNGGAVYNTGTISDLSGTFSSNIASTNGGAIYNTGTVTITSSDGANTTFSGNTANGLSNALYNTGTVNMNAGTDSSIIFNDKITGSNGVISIGGDGTVEFNETVTGNSVTLNSGILKLGLADSLQNVTSFAANGGTLDLRDNEVNNYQLGQSTSVDGTVGLAIDADLSGSTPVADMITAAGAVSGSGSFVFSSANINIMSYADGQTPFWVQVTDENLRDYAGLGSNANIQITGNEPEGYLITYETSHDGVDAGFLRFEHGTLWDAIGSSIEEKAYTMGADETLVNTPALGGNALTVNGNSQGYSITGDNGDGISVGNNQTLSLNNIGIDSTGSITGAGMNSFDTAVANAANGTINLYNTVFSNNTTDIDNDGVVNMSGIVIFDTMQGTGTTNITNDTDGNASTVTVNNSLEQDNINIASGNTLTNDNATVTVNDALNNVGTITGTGTSALVINGDSTNTGTIEQGSLTTGSSATLTNTGNITLNTALTNNGTITTNSENLVADSGITNNGTLIYNAGSQTVSDITGDGSANSHVELRTNSQFTIDNTIANTYIDLYDSTLVFGSNGDISGATALNVNGGGMDFLDGNITSTDLGTVNLNADATLGIDFDLSTLTSDSFTATVNNNGGIFNINQINFFGTTTQDNININLGDTTGLGQDNITSITMDLPSIMTPIRQINGHLENGWLTYAGGSDISDFNPAVLATPVIAQAGIHTVMNNTFQRAYEHADWYTKFSANERSAILEGNPVMNGSHYNQYNGNSAIWFKSYATFEDIPLRPGPKADVKSYGSMLGLDSGFQDWGSDWYGVTSGYIGYNGAQIKYPQVSATMNGGLFGITQTLYKRNFWTGVTANVGANFADARTMYGSENSSIFTTGLGAQTGYNIELGEGNFILQPIWAMNYSMINTFSYTNAAGVKIDPKALHTIQLNPTLRLVGNVNGWQPYASVGMSLNLMGKTDVTADTVGLPEISIKPYLLYNVGVQKAINDNFTGFVQVTGHNGGRNGIDVVGGLRWAFGKSNKKFETFKGNNYTDSSTNTQNIEESKAEEPVAETHDIDAEQENIEAEEPVVNVQKIDTKQQDSEGKKSVANTQEIDKDQENVRAEESVAEDQYIDRNQKDTQAEEEVTSAPEVEDEQSVQPKEAEESGKSNGKTSNSNNLAIAIAIAAAVILGLFLAKRKK